VKVFYFNILEVLIILVPILMSAAFITIGERKLMASMQRRCGPNAVGIWGIGQPFADALKLLVKEIIIPRQSNNLLFVMGPCITLIFAIIGWSIIPFGEGLAIFDYELGIFFVLAVSSLGSYGILISGWAANSKYTFLGAIRSTAQLLSYELVFSSIILILILFSGSFSLTYIVECQQAVWNIFPLMPLALMFFIAILAETNRTPFDLAEAESEIVAGYMTEHGASVFVFFFLAEYSNIILMSALMAIFFLGGQHCPDLHKWILDPILYIYNNYNYTTLNISPIFNLLPNINENIGFSNISEDIKFWDSGLLVWNIDSLTIFNNKNIILESINLLIDKLYGSYILGLKIIIVVFFYIWVRASFPRFRYDQLMSLCWKELLPLVFAYILFTIFLFNAFDMMAYGANF
jgi:NADH-ubiquinone oxidoreductase chain 1